MSNGLLHFTETLLCILLSHFLEFLCHSRASFKYVKSFPCLCKCMSSLLTILFALSQVHINLGIALEGEGMLMCACDHYREAAILNPRHYRALKLLGSALFGLGEYRAAQKCLEEALILRPDYADAHCDLGSALHAVHEDEQASIEFQRAIDLDPNHLDALYNLGGLLKDSGR